MNSPESQDDDLFCSRCCTKLTAGDGDFYLVHIQAMADPTPPSFSEEDLQHNPREEIRLLLEKMRKLSAQEAMDQVYRQVILYLCGPCYRQWIENPVG